MRSRIYVGHIVHARTVPVVHQFRYPMFTFAIDIDELPELDSRLKLFGHNRRALFSLYEADYLGDKGTPLRDKLNYWRRRTNAVIDLHRVELVTIPRVVGHAFNPVSFYYCYCSDGSLSGVVTEVNNTFGEVHVYMLDEPQPELADTIGHHRFSARKRFHVSPFNDLAGTYEFDFGPLGKCLDVSIEIQRSCGKTFSSRLYGNARKIDNRALCRLAATYPLSAALTLPRILYQAYKLHYHKGLPVVPKPPPSSLSTARATRPAYMSEFAAPTWLQRQNAPKVAERNHNGSH